jgi:cell division protein FtsW (lipid II flippase)
MLYIATARLAFVAGAVGLFLIGSYAVSQGTPHVRDRVQNWISPWSTHKIYCPLSGQPSLRQNCQSYQEVQSLYSLGHGGFGGTGLGHGIFTGTTGHQVIPDLNTDFIYSALAQELGLVGVAAVLLLYMAFVLRGFRIALASSDGFSKLLAAGLSFGFAFQTFVIVGGITRVIPLTGITLPFVSYGGSSIVANFLLVAGLMLISHRANRAGSADGQAAGARPEPQARPLFRGPA